MFRNTTFRIWPLLSDLEIPDYLEWMESRGLQFTGMKFFGLVGAFRKVKPADTRYAWDYFSRPDGTEIEGTLQGYLDFCESAGWDIAWQFDKNKIFREVREKAPAPFHTDDEILWKKRKKKVLCTEVKNFCFLLLLAAAYLFLIILARRAEFLVESVYVQLSVIMVIVLMVGSLVWNLWYMMGYFLGARNRTREGQETVKDGRGKGFGIKRAFFHTVLQVLVCTTAVLMLVCLAADGGNLGILAGVSIGVSIGVWIRRSFLGMGTSARKAGMKGIPPFRRWHRPVLVILPVLLTILAFSSAVQYRGKDTPVHGFNLYCSILYRTDKDMDWAPGYYLARDEGYADRIEKYYRECVMSSWGGRWERVSAATVPSLLPVGPYETPDLREPEAMGAPGAAGETEVFHYLWPDNRARDTGYWLIRRGREIWMTRGSPFAVSAPSVC